MPTDVSTLAELRRIGIVGSLEIVAAIDAYMVDSSTGPYRFSSGHSLDISALVGPASEREKLVTKSGPHAKAFRTRVAEIVMAAHPTPP